MTSASPQSLALLGRAAELRAAGTPWADTATQLAVEAAELRRLTAEHRRDYERLARRARAEFRRETFHEALATLRAQLKSPDDRVRFMASTTLIRFEMVRMRHGAKTASEKLERDARRSKRKHRKLTLGAHHTHDANTSESPKVPVLQEVNAPQKVAQSSPPPVAPTPAPTLPQAPIAGNNSPLSDADRRKQRLLMQAALGRGAPAPLTRNGRQTAEAERLVRNWLAE